MAEREPHREGEKVQRHKKMRLESAHLEEMVETTGQFLGSMILVAHENAEKDFPLMRICNIHPKTILAFEKVGLGWVPVSGPVIPF